MNRFDEGDLLQSYLDGELSSEQAALLETRLRREPELADALLKLAREEAIISEWARAATVADRAIAEKPFSGTIAPRVFRRQRQTALWVALPAAVVVLVASALFLKRGSEENSPDILAHLEEFQGDVNVITSSGSILAAKTGQELFAGQGVRTEGEGSFAVVKYADKTRLELSTDTLVDLLSDRGTGSKGKQIGAKKVFLREGVLRADVADQPEDKPLVLLTPHAEAKLRKTSFSSASGQGATRIELDEGSAQFIRKSDGKVIEVPTGWYAVASLPAEPFAARPLPTRVNQAKALLRDRTGPVMAVVFAAEGNALLIGSWDGSVTVWDAVSDRVRTLVEGRGVKISCLGFSRDGQVVAIGSERTLKLWATFSGKELVTLESPKGRITAVAFAPDGQQVAAGYRDKSVRLWNTITGELQATLPGFKSEIAALAFAPDGKTLATVGGLGKDAAEAMLWNVATREKFADLQGHERIVRSVAFSPDGTTLATASNDGSVRIWDAATGRELRAIRGRTRPVTFVCFSPDGRSLATVSNDGTVRLLDAAAGRERRAYRAAQHRPYCVAFSPDGKTLATGGWDRTVRLWDSLSADADSGLSFRDKADTATMWEGVLVASIPFRTGRCDLPPVGLPAANAADPAQRPVLRPPGLEWNATSSGEDWRFLSSAKGRTIMKFSLLFQL
jgi:WD40 repeat protein